MQKGTVVRRIMEKEDTEGKVEHKCSLCDRVYQTAKALREHLKKKHEGDEALEQALDSAKDTCLKCGIVVQGIYKHRKICDARPRPEAPKQQAPSSDRVVQQQPRHPHPYPGVSNAGMVEMFEKRLTNRLKLDPKGTIPDYVRDFKNFIQHELKLDPGFHARDWFFVGSREHPDQRFKPLRSEGDYREALTTDQGKATLNRMHTVYSHLHRWIDEHLSEQCGDPLSLHRQKGERAKEDRAVAHRSGAHNPGQGRKEKTDTVTQHRDVGIIREVLNIAVNSRLREETMAKFAQGDFTHKGCKGGACNDCRCRLGIRSEVDAENFLALSLFLCNRGLRLDGVLNVTIGGLVGASHSLDVCPYCGGHYPYAEHKRLCHR